MELWMWFFVFALAAFMLVMGALEDTPGRVAFGLVLIFLIINVPAC